MGAGSSFCSDEYGEIVRKSLSELSCDSKRIPCHNLKTGSKSNLHRKNLSVSKPRGSYNVKPALSAQCETNPQQQNESGIGATSNLTDLKDPFDKLLAMGKFSAEIHAKETHSSLRCKTYQKVLPIHEKSMLNFNSNVDFLAGSCGNYILIWFIAEEK